MPYREDTGKKDQGRALLDEGSAPPMPNEDDPTIMAMTTSVKTTGPKKPQVSELFTSPLAQHSSLAGQKIPLRGQTTTAARSMAQSSL
jgi:hypothetical protein